MRSLYEENLKQLEEKLVIPSFSLGELTFIEHNNISLGFSWDDCGTASNPIQIKNMAISPDPINIPGTETVSLDITVKEKVATATSLTLTIKKKIFGVYITVPCVDNIGSCTYENPCDMLKNVTCPPDLVKKGFTCHCPFEPNHYTLDNSQMKIPKLTLPSFVENGDYEIKAVLMNGDQQLVCFSITASLHAA